MCFVLVRSVWILSSAMKTRNALVCLNRRINQWRFFFSDAIIKHYFGCLQQDNVWKNVMWSNHLKYVVYINMMAIYYRSSWKSWKVLVFERRPEKVNRRTISSCCVFVCLGESHPVFFSSLFSLRSDLMYTWTLSSLTVQPQPNLPCFQHHITAPLFYCSFLVFMDDVCLPRRPLFRFLPLTGSTVKCISIPGSFFFHYVAYRSVIVIISLSDKVVRGLLSHQEFTPGALLFTFVAQKAHTYFLLLSLCHFFTYFSLLIFPAYVHILLSLFPSLSTSPPPRLSPLPRRVRSAVLTLGIVQICSLRGWKVVMRAKKNSLALRLTTRRVFQMKPNENSIFCPCYSPPSHPPSL